MDDLDFVGWNNADWTGVFAHHHTDDVLVDWQGQPQTRGVEEHIEAMKFLRRTERGRYTAPDHLRTRSSLAPAIGRASSGSSKMVLVW